MTEERKREREIGGGWDGGGGVVGEKEREKWKEGRTRQRWQADGGGAGWTIESEIERKKERASEEAREGETEGEIRADAAVLKPRRQL